MELSDLKCVACGVPLRKTPSRDLILARSSNTFLLCVTCSQDAAVACDHDDDLPWPPRGYIAA